jgi:hypothetical protein
MPDHPLTSRAKPREHERPKRLRWSSDEAEAILATWAQSRDSGRKLEFLAPCDQGLKSACRSVADEWGLEFNDLYSTALDKFTEKLEVFGMDICQTKEHVLGRLGDFIGYSVSSAAEKAVRRRNRHVPIEGREELRDSADDVAKVDELEELDLHRGILYRCIAECLKGKEYSIAERMWLVPEDAALSVVQLSELLRITPRQVRNLRQSAFAKVDRCCHARLRR